MLPADGRANSLHRVEGYPDYGAGVGGWREAISLAGNVLAGLGVGAAEKRKETSFYCWLLSQARAVNASLLVCALPQ